MVSTLQLAALVRQAKDAGAKILLVGDPAQLDSIEAGGVLGWLDRQGKAARLSTIWRFKDPWERSASLGLREGRSSVLAEYEDHGRIRHGHYSEMVDRAYAAWHSDVLAGCVSVNPTVMKRRVLWLGLGLLVGLTTLGIRSLLGDSQNVLSATLTVLIPVIAALFASRIVRNQRD